MANILVADDDSSIKELLSFILERDGHTITEANDGQIVKNLVAQQKFDLLILDIMMPNMDGYSLVMYLRNNPELSGMPVVIVSAKKDIKELFMSAPNVVDCFEKPFEVNDLRARIRKILRERNIV